MDTLKERLAKIIDPEAFGLPVRKAVDGSDYLTDRDEARDKALDAIMVMLAATDPIFSPSGAPDRPTIVFQVQKP